MVHLEHLGVEQCTGGQHANIFFDYLTLESVNNICKFIERKNIVKLKL